MPVLVPDTLDEALASLSDRPGSTLVAGGTDLMVGINAGRTRPEQVIALGRLADLRWWDDGDERLSVGAGVSYSAMTRDPIAAKVPLLAQAARTVGSPQIRNAGTLGGNLGTASPAGDGVAALVALGATVHLRSATSQRTVPAEDFVTAPRRTVRSEDELVTHVSVPVLDGPQEFVKVGTRNAMVIAVASAALVTDPGARQVRLALGSVGPTVLRCPEAEALAASAIDWSSLTAPAQAAQEFGRLAAAASRPIDDHRSTATYRRRAVEVIARRAFERAYVR